jgi:peptidoglycan/LPS O-acetylase OafA/YrhL
VTGGSRGSGRHLQVVDDLRGLAILAIVLLHSANAMLNRGLSSPPTPSTRVIAAANDILFHNSTIYFALISGIIYAHVFAGRPHGGFMRARLANVGAPYLVMTAGLTLLLALARDGAPLDEVPVAIARNLLLGEAWNTFWYIPVILLLYALSPLLLRLMTDPRLGWAATLMLVQPLLLTRTGTELTPQMFAYFAGVYCCGLLVGGDIERSLVVLRREQRFLVSVALTSGLVLVLLHAASLDQVRLGPLAFSVRESVTYILRLSTAGLALVLLSGWACPPGRQPRRFLGLVAATSFGIYFLHGPLLRPVVQRLGAFIPPEQPLLLLLLAILLSAAVVLALCLGLLLALKRLLGPRSRYLTGY